MHDADVPPCHGPSAEPHRVAAWQTARVTARRVLPLLLSISALAVAAPGAGAKPVGGIQSVAVSATQTPPQTDLILDRATAVGAKLLRVTVVWSDLEPKQGQQDAAYLAAADRLVDGASARGIRTLLVVVGTPCWASSAPGKDCTKPNSDPAAGTRYPPTNAADFVNVSTFLATRYGTKLAAFEVWNEPDQSNELYWAGPDKVQRYVALTQAAYAPLKAANPQMTVLAGAFVGTSGKWLQALYDAGIKGSYDALSVHFYDLPLYGLEQTHAVQKRNHDSAPLWLAETGFSSCYVKGRKDAATDHACLTRAGQAQALTDLFAATKATSWLKATIVYALQDESTAYQFGLYDAAGKTKPSAAAVRRAFTNKTLRPTRPTLRLSKKRGRVVVRATGSWIEVYAVSVKINGQLRYRANARTDRFGRITITLPRSLGTHHLKVKVFGRWTHKQVARSTS
jgi:hypothetical protein